MEVQAEHTRNLEHWRQESQKQHAQIDAALRKHRECMDQCKREIAAYTCEIVLVFGVFSFVALNLLKQ